MMASTIFIVGAGRKNGIFQDQIARYVKMLSPHTLLNILYAKSSVKAKGNKTSALALEGVSIRSKWPKRVYPVALSTEGKLYDSFAFSQWLSKQQASGLILTFNIGGAYGLAPSLKLECREVISLSTLTFSHQLCLLLLIEQIYRAFTILKDHPYHK